jgi:hypothetical protein
MQMFQVGGRGSDEKEHTRGDKGRQGMEVGFREEGRACGKWVGDVSHWRGKVRP